MNDRRFAHLPLTHKDMRPQLGIDLVVSCGVATFWIVIQKFEPIAAVLVKYARARGGGVRKVNVL